MQSWSRDEGSYITTPHDVEQFLKALEGLLQVYDYSIFHEDMEGAFIIKNGFDVDSSRRLKGSMLEGFKND